MAINYNEDSPSLPILGLVTGVQTCLRQNVLGMNGLPDEDIQPYSTLEDLKGKKVLVDGVHGF